MFGSILKKGIWVFSINSYSFLKANQYRSQAGDKIIIDTVTPDENMIESLFRVWARSMTQVSKVFMLE